MDLRIAFQTRVFVTNVTASPRVSTVDILAADDIVADMLLRTCFVMLAVIAEVALTVFVMRFATEAVSADVALIVF